VRGAWRVAWRISIPTPAHICALVVTKGTAAGVGRRKSLAAARRATLLPLHYLYRARAGVVSAHFQRGVLRHGGNVTSCNPMDIWRTRAGTFKNRGRHQRAGVRMATVGNTELLFDLWLNVFCSTVPYVRTRSPPVCKKTSYDASHAQAPLDACRSACIKHQASLQACAQ